MSKVTILTKPNRIVIASKGVQGAPGKDGVITPELEGLRDDAQQAAQDAAGSATIASDAAGAAVAAQGAAEGSAGQASASADLAEQARLLGASIGFATKADMDASLAHPDGTLALVTNDPTAENNGTYRWTGSEWVQSADRVTALEQRTADVPRLLGTSRNLFNADTATDGVIVGSGGNTSPDANRYTSDFIPVTPSTQYTYSPAAVSVVYAFYTSDKAYIAPFASHASTFTTPANAAYVRVSPRYSDWAASEFMLVEGTALPLSYEWWRGKDYVRLGDVGSASGVAALDSDGKLSLDAVRFYDSRNLFDPTAIANGIYIGPTGTPTSDSGFFTSDFIPVVPGATYRWSTIGPQKYASWWDEDRNFISAAFYTGQATPPAGAAYIRVSPRHSETPPSTFMLVNGAMPSEYQPPASMAIERQSNKNQAGGYAGLGDDGKIQPNVIPAGGFGRILEGKTIAGLGDSITYGFIPRNDPDYPGRLQSWLPLVAEELGASEINYGLSGSTLGANASGADQPMSRRFAAMDDSADLVIVMGGTNDVRKSVPLGVMGDTEDTTYYGALDVLCQGLLNKYRYAQGTDIGSEKKIMFMTPLRLLNVGSPDDLHPALPDYCDAVKEVCEKYAIPVFDAYNLSGLTPELFRTVQGTEVGYTDLYNPYVTDGTHPTQEGQEIFADAVAGFIRTLY